MKINDLQTNFSTVVCRRVVVSGIALDHYYIRSFILKRSLKELFHSISDRSPKAGKLRALLGECTGGEAELPLDIGMLLSGADSWGRVEVAESSAGVTSTSALHAVLKGVEARGLTVGTVAHHVTEHLKDARFHASAALVHLGLDLSEAGLALCAEGPAGSLGSLLTLALGLTALGDLLPTGIVHDLEVAAEVSNEASRLLSHLVHGVKESLAVLTDPLASIHVLLLSALLHAHLSAFLQFVPASSGVGTSGISREGRGDDGLEGLGLNIRALVVEAPLVTVIDDGAWRETKFGLELTEEHVTRLAKVGTGTALGSLLLALTTSLPAPVPVLVSVVHSGIGAVHLTGLGGWVLASLDHALQLVSESTDHAGLLTHSVLECGKELTTVLAGPDT